MKKFFFVVAAPVAFSQSAMAALPATATTAITTFGTDFAAAVLAVMVAVAAAWGLKKLMSKTGIS